MPKYPNISVRLVGEDGNAFSIISRVVSALRRAGVQQDKVDAFKTQAMSGDYGHLLRTVMEWVSVEMDDDEDEDTDDDEEGCWVCGESQYNCSCDEDE